MQSYFQSAVAFFTSETIFRGVMVGPDGYFRGSFCPVASSFTFVPPTSITSTFPDFPAWSDFMDAPPRNNRAARNSCRALRILEASAVSAKKIRPEVARKLGSGKPRGKGRK